MPQSDGDDELYKTQPLHLILPFYFSLINTDTALVSKHNSFITNDLQCSKIRNYVAFLLDTYKIIKNKK